MDNNVEKMREINCLRCNKPKQTIKAHTKFCSPSCRVQYFNDSKIQGIVNKKDEYTAYLENRIKELELQLTLKRTRKVTK